MTGALSIPAEKLLEETRWLQSLASSLAGPADCDDLAQTTWLRALERAPSDVRGWRPWLRTVLRHAFLRARRDERVRLSREKNAARDEAVPSSADMVARTSLHRAVADAVLSLEEPARSTVLLRFFDDRPPREIARLQGIPVATVRTRLRRALAVLRNRLDHELGGRETWVSAVGPMFARAAAAPAAEAASSVALAGVLLMTLKTKAWLAAGAMVVLSIGIGVALIADRGRPGPAPPIAAGEGEEERPRGVGIAPSSGAPGSRSPVVSTPYVEREPGAADFAVTGRVIAANTEAPVAGAEVTATAPDSAEGRGERTSTRTERDGRFKLMLPRPRYQFELEAFSPEFARRELVIHEGQKGLKDRKDYDVGDVTLERGAELRGRVVDERGAPVGGAAILVLRQWRGKFGFNHLEGGRQLAESAPDGSFALSERVACDEPERLIVAVTADLLGWGWFAVAPGAESVDPITIGAGRGQPVRVRLVDEDERAVPGAVVMAYPRFEPVGTPRYPGEQIFFWPCPALDARVRRFFYATSGEDGIATLPGLPIGVHADDARFHVGHDALDDYDFLVQTAPYDLAKVACRVLGAHDDPVVITLRQPRAFKLSGRVRDREGRPIAGATVSVFHGTLKGQSDAGGAYVVDGIRSDWDKCPVEASADGYGSQTLELQLPESGESAVRNFILPRGLRVKGRVVDESGAKVTGWTISLHRHDDRTLRVQATVANGENGVFEFQGVAEGEWAIWSRPPERGRWEVPGSRSIRAGDLEVDFVVRKLPDDAATVIVDVVDATTGGPADVADARFLPAAIFIGGRSYTVPQQKREKGRVTFVDVMPGAWKLTVRTTDGRRVAKAVEVPAKEPTVRVHVAVEPPGAILGRLVLDGLPADRQPERVSVVAHGEGEGLPTTLEGKPIEGFVGAFAYAHKSDGYRFRFADFTPGRRVTLFVHDDRLFGHAEVEISAGADAPVEIRCIASATIVREVEDPTPDARLVFYLRRPGGAPVRIDWRVDTKAEEVQVPAGRFPWRAELYELRPGAADRSMRVLEGELDLVPGETRTLRLDFPE